MSDRKPIRLRAELHESVMTERRGQFRIICGCRWESEFGTPEAVEAAYDAHLAYVDAEVAATGSAGAL